MPALILDCDGVLADTERHGHLPAFNRTFEEFGLDVRWDEQTYADKLRIGGGKERMASLLTPDFVAAHDLPTDEAGRARTLATWHAFKTAAYTDMVSQGLLPARPGVVRLVEEAHGAGWSLAVASTSAEASVRAVLSHVVGPDRVGWFSVYAGDLVERKKPAPDIYLAALAGLGVGPEEAVAVEDSANGFRAALAAGLRTVVTTNAYTVDEDFTGAALVVSSLGEPDHPADVASDPLQLGTRGVVTLATLSAVLRPDR